MTTTTIPATGAQTPPDGGEKKLFSDLVPAEFRDRPYLKDILVMPQGPDAYNELFKKLDGAEKLVGKKSEIPADDAKPEEWSKFHERFRPKTSEEYAVSELVAPNPAVAKVLKEAFHESGMSKAQADKFQAKLGAAIKARDEALDQEFQTLKKATFGDDAAAQEAQDRAKTMLVSLVPENVKSFIPKLSNEGLVILTAALNAVHKKHGVEDHMDPGGAGGDGSDAIALREQAKKLLASPEYKDEFNPRHAEVRAKVEALYAEVAKRTK